MNATMLALLAVNFERWQNGVTFYSSLEPYVRKTATQLGLDDSQAIRDLRRWQLNAEINRLYTSAIT